MKRGLIGCLGATAIAAASSLLTLAGVWLGARPVTTCRLSPDETLRVWLVEGPRHTERNFAIRLERLTTQTTVNLLAWSPDEGLPLGTERFLWSKDGTRILLVGRHFFVRDDLMLDNGDQAYFLHDTKSGHSWINSAADHQFPPLTADLIARVEFTEPVVLKPRAKVGPDSFEKRE